ncbi:hypothetical protein HZS_7928 [Henneguya salminicola]|nr:hypothetical protein HZS_7928 [Henneguya salminicola]
MRNYQNYRFQIFSPYSFNYLNINSSVFSRNQYCTSILKAGFMPTWLIRFDPDTFRKDHANFCSFLNIISNEFTFYEERCH